MDNILGVLKNTILISLFHKGQAGKIFESVKKRSRKLL